MIALGYARQSVSNADDGQDSVSVTFQERRIRESGNRDGYTVEHVYADVDVRGHVAIRKGLDALRARIREGGVAVVYVYDMSRLARETGLFVSLLDELKKSGVRLVSTREPTDERWLQILFGAFAERDKMILSARVGDAMRERAQLGQFVGSVPIGYQRVAGKELGDRTVRRLAPAPLAPVVREAYARYDAGDSIAGIARWLNEPGQPAPLRAKRWSVPSVSWMLRNSAYAGDVVVKADDRHPEIVIRDAHPAIIDRELWNRVQRRLAAAGRREIPRTRKPGRHWLEGRVFCACGAPMYLFVKKHVSDGHELKSWGCRKDNAARSLTGSGGGCPLTRSVVGNRRVEPKVLARLAADLQTMADQLPEIVPTLADANDTERDELTVRLDDVKERRRRNARAVETADDPSYFVAVDNRLANEERTLAAELANRPASVTPERIERARLAAKDASTRVTAAAVIDNQQGLRALAGEVGLRVVVDGEGWRVTVEYDEPFARLLAP